MNKEKENIMKIYMRITNERSDPREATVRLAVAAPVLISWGIEEKQARAALKRLAQWGSPVQKVLPSGTRLYLDTVTD